MSKIWKPLVLILVAGIMAANLYLDYRADAHTQTEEGSPLAVDDLPVGTSTEELAPDFTGVTIDGQSITLSDMRGKLVLVNVFASWCGPCRLETPHLVEVFDQVKDDNIVFIGLNLSETPEAVSLYRDEFAVTYPLVLNQDGRLTEIYRPIGLPTSWFIGSDGVVEYVFAGPMTKDMLRGILNDIQAGREPDPFATTSG